MKQKAAGCKKTAVKGNQNVLSHLLRTSVDITAFGLKNLQIHTENIASHKDEVPSVVYLRGWIHTFLHFSTQDVF